jgi:hypothetical protein
MAGGGGGKRTANLVRARSITLALGQVERRINGTKPKGSREVTVIHRGYLDFPGCPDLVG